MKLAVIADDLTGANATGVLLSKQGFLTATIVKELSCPSLHYDALCINTDSRYVLPSEAKCRVSEAVSLMQQQGVAMFCKRIDSTLRGNLGTEIDAVLTTLGDEAIAIVQPSFPASGRITLGGYLLVHGVLLHDTDVARDPISPVTQSRVAHIIAEQSKQSIDQIDMDIVQRGSEAIEQQINQMAGKGKRIIVVDAVTEDHITALAHAMTRIKCVCVAVDPGPLSAAYAQAQFGPLTRGPKVLAVVGSVTSLTERQLNHFINKWEIQPVYVCPESLVKGKETRQQTMKHAVNTALNQLVNSGIILITTCQPDYPLLNLSALAEQMKTTTSQLAKGITDDLALISRSIIEQSEGAIGGYFSSGGEVTASLCSVTEAKGIALADEVLPLAAYGHFIDGYLEHMPVVTKGGLVGDDTAISACVQFLLTKLSKT